MRPQALIIDDEPDILDLLLMTLENMGVDCRTAETIKQAHAALSEQLFDICLTDMRLPDGDGIDLVKMMQKKYPQIPVAVITAHGSMELAVLALKAGAFDFVSKPLKLKVLRDLVSTALKLSRKNEAVIDSQESARTTLLGKTPAIQDVQNKIAKLARSQAPVYISGESGTGKELVARLIHKQGARADSAFVAVNCGAIPSELVESEFFGHKKGAFTGAISDKQGLFQAANGGTLFLDEIADLPLAMQVKLLRALQEKSVRPVGGNEEISINVRVLSATHSNLAEKVKQGQFREDLFYRVNVIELHVPPLRDRVEDISLLSDHILQKLAESNEIQKVSLNKSAINALQKYSFPGNVRELENILERALTWLEGDVISVADLMLPEENRTDTVDVENKKSGLIQENDLESHLEDQERQLITQALESTRWNKTAAAKKLGITFRALRYKLKKLNLE
ncbi:MAG: sigma-54-dependent Fis family transcriptional regulator [Piscirickettsiaceae bacterium]|nr:sigma-54-dependent Fis family transcriptional regulator [Piscirickettsiaceae bacterium]